MSLRTMMQAGPAKANDLFARLLEASGGAVKLPWDKSPCLASGDTHRANIPNLCFATTPCGNIRVSVQAPQTGSGHCPVRAGTNYTSSPSSSSRVGSCLEVS